jgi:tetratricopeptide (TPR) repeat protein
MVQIIENCATIHLPPSATRRGPGRAAPFIPFLALIGRVCRLSKEWFNTGYALWKQRQFDQAAEKFRAVLDRSRNDQDATAMLGRCLKMEGPRPGDTRSEGRERIKTTFEDSAFRQLQAELKGKR